MPLGVHTDEVRDAHPYTHVKTPWDVADYIEGQEVERRGKRFGWRLYRYLSGGGMRAFGRTVHQDLVARRQRRFLWAGALFGLAWFIFWVA